MTVLPPPLSWTPRPTRSHTSGPGKPAGRVKHPAGTRSVCVMDQFGRESCLDI